MLSPPQGQAGKWAGPRRPDVHTHAQAACSKIVSWAHGARLEASSPAPTHRQACSPRWSKIQTEFKFTPATPFWTRRKTAPHMLRFAQAPPTFRPGLEAD
ncbi:hypothetical protein Pcinc_026106 [Petrolisthes cinctipes]|uniref:Uncharacterized protein n=1 Tax=Petrolisthes cinctipes TaxID=88211 RepID=A0AAE1F7X2_PETCI|nr:hypothetical protein Pcinc_026106 [Petrolisthes cinctipes]